MAAVVYYPKFSYKLADGTPAVGFKLFTYVAGSSTPLPTYTDNTLGTENPNPTELDANGEMVGFPPDGNPAYKLVLKTPADVTVWTVDWVTFGGGAIEAPTEWVDSEMTPTYLSATSFSVTGDQTSVFAPGQRIRSINNGGTAYSTVASSAFSVTTTVTVTNDSTPLDAGMSDLFYALLSALNLSSPVVSNLIIGPANISIPSNSTTIVHTDNTAVGDRLNEYTAATGRFTAKVTGNYLVQMSGWLIQNGANVTLGNAFLAQLYKNGVSTGIGSAQSWPFATAAASNIVPINSQQVVALTAGQYVDWRIVTPTYTTATMSCNSSMTVRRLP